MEGDLGEVDDVAAPLERCPDLGPPVALDLGAKVATGEMTWG
ncbi:MULTISPECIES: hypothetical protein [unclassified Streptomyces]|nr:MULTISPECIES: hypothetical protein [unclassified Streptomyces]